MISTRSAKAVVRHEESVDVQTQAAIDDGDRVLLASINSFPASDPPGWIEVKAHPCSDETPPARHDKAQGVTRI